MSGAKDLSFKPACQRGEIEIKGATYLIKRKHHPLQIICQICHTYISISILGSGGSTTDLVNITLSSRKAQLQHRHAMVYQVKQSILRSEEMNQLELSWSEVHNSQIESGKQTKIAQIGLGSGQMRGRAYNGMRR